ncbi:unnamed protein product [Microthlaspi erraticum]|uniref:Arabidopsis retrotransposon Orf1 C-terminal domain-containing protein n=1 Tax=Microthlaspi erraticum TaxID=1685480 RepID=A0A6D2KHE5_9BRAS|nr:unnamed protein product [Microthlaspi erraticum]
MTLFPTKFENGKIEYKIRYKGRSRPFSRAKALVTSEQSRDPTKLKELLSQVTRSQLDRQLDRARNKVTRSSSTTRPRDSTLRSNKFKMLRGEGSKAAFTKEEIMRGARRMLKTLTKEDEEEIERLREERRTKRRNDPISSESELGEFEIGVNIGREKVMTPQMKKGKRLTRDEGSKHESNENVPMEEAESEEEEDELPMYQEHYNALFSMDFVETKYPHDDTMRALGIFEDVELVLKNMRLAKFFSHRMESYKELTCEFLASMRFHKYDELDRAELDQGWGWITFLARGERKVITFRQLEILFGFSSLKSKAAQIRSHVLRYVHKALANTFFARKATGTINEGEVKLLDMGIKPIISRTKDGKKIRGDRIHAGNLMPLLEQLLSYKTTAYSTRFQQGRKREEG